MTRPFAGQQIFRASSAILVGAIIGKKVLTMAEYIKKADVLEYLSARRNQVLKSPLSTLDAKFEVMEIFDFVDHRVESADVAPVRHGRWLCVDTDTEQFFLCNRCKKKEYWESNYCPNCGCRMDLEG